MCRWIARDGGDDRLQKAVEFPDFRGSNSASPSHPLLTSHGGAGAGAGGLTPPFPIPTDSFPAAAPPSSPPPLPPAVPAAPLAPPPLPAPRCGRRLHRRRRQGGSRQEGRKGPATTEAGSCGRRHRGGRRRRRGRRRLGLRHRRGSCRPCWLPGVLRARPQHRKRRRNPAAALRVPCVLRHLRSHAHPHAVRMHCIPACVGYLSTLKIAPWFERFGCKRRWNLARISKMFPSFSAILSCL